MSEPRWVDDHGVSDLSVAVDEIYALRAMLADEARILVSHLAYKTFPKSRREVAERQIERMSQAARGDYYEAAKSRALTARSSVAKDALLWAGAKGCLTNHQWAEQRGLTLTEHPTTALDGGTE